MIDNNDFSEAYAEAFVVPARAVADQLKEIEDEFGRYIRNCVEVLTHDKEAMSYSEYIDLIMDCPLPEAKLVKHADMRDHLRQKETLTPKLKEKYYEVIDRFI